MNTATPTGSLPLDSRELRDAIGMFGSDVLGGWGADSNVQKWTLAPSGAYRATKGRAVPSDVLEHLTGEATLAVGRITRAIVIDADLTAKGVRATAEQKDAARTAVELLLHEFSIPALHFDSARGLHTWIRCATSPSDSTLAAVRGAIESNYTGPGTIEVWPQGGKGIRLPWGVYGGERRPVPDMPNEDLLRWFAFPTRASDEQLAAVEAAFPPPPPEKPQEKRALVSPVPDPTPTADAPKAAPGRLHPPAPCTGWERWPVCKQLLAIKGPLAGRRHNTLNALACEAVESGERDRTRLLTFLLAVPRPHSATPQHEHRQDAAHAAGDALYLKETNDPKRFSSCPHVPRHSGVSAPMIHRSTFEHLCTDDAAAACPINDRWRREQHLPAYDHILHSSIWRGGQGAGRGLGLAAKAVYRLLLQMSGGNTERPVSASTKYIALKLKNEVTLRQAPRLRTALLDTGLLVRVEATPHDFLVPMLTPPQLAHIEAQLGTDVLAARAEKEILDRLDEARKYRA